MEPALNQPDGIHPNARGVAALVDRIAPHVAKLLGGRVMTSPFAAAFAEGDPATLASRLVAQLPQESGATLGVLYVSEPAAQALPLVLDELAAATGIADWVGGVGLGVCAAGRETYELPAAAVLTAPLPTDKFRLFAATGDPGADLPRHHAELDRERRSRAWRWCTATRAARYPAARDGRRRQRQRRLPGRRAVSHRCPDPLVAGEVGDGQRAADALGTPARRPAARPRYRRRHRADRRAARRSARCTASTRRATTSSWRSTAARRWRCSTRISGRSWPRPARASARLIFAGCRWRLRHRRLPGAQPDGDRPAAGLDRAGGRSVAGRPDPVLPPRPGQRQQGPRPHAATSSRAACRDRRRPGSMSAASLAAPRCSASPGSRAG